MSHQDQPPSKREPCIIARWLLSDLMWRVWYQLDGGVLRLIDDEWELVGQRSRVLFMDFL